MPKKKTALTIEERLQQALVPAEEQPYEVPENWVWVRLGAIAEIVTGGTPSKKHPEYYGGNFPFYKPSDLDQGRLTYDASEYLSEEGKNVSRIIPKNSTAVCCIGSIGKCGYLMCEGTTNQQINSAIPKINSLCLYYYLCTENFVQDLLSMASATTIAIVNKSKMESCAFPLPPLSEQQRIVERIEELLAKLDEAKERLQEVADSFAVRKAAILHKAFTGELTKQWRRENGVSDESWEEITWGSFIEKIEAGKNWNALGRPPKNGEFGVVKVSAVTWGEFLEDESKTCTEESQWNEEKRISVGDFLFSRANTIQLVGNCVIVKDVKRKLMLSDKILRFSLSERVYDFFALWYTRTSSYRKQIESVASGNQDGMRNISQNNMKMIIFPLPTLPEQHEIVRLIDDLLARERAGAFKAGAGGKLKLNKNQDLGSGKS